MLRELFYKLILKQLKDSKTIIDIGAGSSIYKWRYAKRKIRFYEFVEKYKSFKVDATDINPENEKIKKLDFMDINKDYDVFFSSHFLPYIDALKYMEVAKKYCRKYLVTITSKNCKKFWNDPYNIRPYTIQAVKTLYIHYGFEPIKTYNLGISFCVIGKKKD